MKANSFIAVLILLLPSAAFTQQSKNSLRNWNYSSHGQKMLPYINSNEFNAFKKKGKLSIGLLAGNKVGGKLGGEFGGEISYNVSDKVALVGNYVRRSMNEKDHYFNENDYAGGVRYYGTKGRLKLFVESLINLNIQKENLFGFSENTHISNSMGVTLGAGTEFVLSNKFSCLLKFNMTKLVRPESYKGLYGGVKYDF